MLTLCKEVVHSAVWVNSHSCVTPRLYPSRLGRKEVLIYQQKEVSVTVNWLHAHVESKGCCKNVSLHFRPEYSRAVKSVYKTHHSGLLPCPLITPCSLGLCHHSASSLGPYLHSGSRQLCHPLMVMVIIDLGLPDFLKNGISNSQTNIFFLINDGCFFNHEYIIKERKLILF